jgi:hypothetical protein
MWGELTDQALDPRTILPRFGIVAPVKKGERVIATPNNVLLIVLPIRHNCSLADLRSSDEGQPHR